MCGNREGPLFWGACRVLEGSDSLGDRYRYFAGYRCADPKACRKRPSTPESAATRPTIASRTGRSLYLGRIVFT
jgi:hypothetical protein